MFLRTAVVTTVTLGLVIGTVSAAGAAGPSDPAALAASSPSTRNHISKAGNAAQWVQPPYLKTLKNGRIAVKATVYLDPLVTKKGKRKQDTLKLRVAVAKKKYARAGTPSGVAVLPDSRLLLRASQSYRIKRSGTAAVTLTLPRRVSKNLAERSKRARRSAIAVSVEHWKDTSGSTRLYDVKQISPAPVLSKFSKTQRSRLLNVAKAQNGRTSTAASAVLASTQGNSPFYNNVYLDNNTPFQQQVSFNPDIQCMWTGLSTYAPNQGPGAVQATVQSGQSAMVQYTGVWDPNFNSGGGQLAFQSPWPGLNGATKGMNSPGSQGSLSTDLTNSANAAGQNALGALYSGSTYSTAGVVGAIAAATVKFTLSFLKGLDSKSSCTNVSTFPQLFGLSTVVTGIGTNGVTDATQATLTPTNTWAGNPAAGNQGATTAVPDTDFLVNVLQPTLGAQTNALYYWNGGQSAPMVSNNAASGEFTGGSATFQGGLFQYLGPNPGTPYGQAECIKGYSWNCTKKYPKCETYCQYDPYGEMHIQLSFLSNPEFNSGMYADPSAPPAMTATLDPNTGQYTLQCSLAQVNASLFTPFGQGTSTTEISGTTLAGAKVNNSDNTATNTAQDADWLVTFFGVDANGNQVYNNASLQPGPDGLVTPQLGPNAGQQNISIAAAATSGSGNTAVGYLSSADMQAMSTLSGTPSTPVTFGCSATPTVSLPGLDITAGATSDIGQNFGSEWPYPTKAQSGWPSSSFPNSSATNWSWMSGVKALNVSFQGLPISDTTAVPAGSQASQLARRK